MALGVSRLKLWIFSLLFNTLFHLTKAKRVWVLFRASHGFQVKDSSASFANLQFVYALLYPFYYPSDSLGSMLHCNTKAKYE